MTHQEKVTKVLKTYPDYTQKQAEEQVHMLNWITEEDKFLKSIYPNYKKDIDPKASFMAMCVALWEDESTGIKQANYFLN